MERRRVLECRGGDGGLDGAGVLMQVVVSPCS